MILRGNVPSAVLGMDTGITIIAPGTYELRDWNNFEKRPLKIVYLLHGLYGNSDSWADNTMLPAYASDYHALFILPEAARSLYTDMAYGLSYFTYISEELPLICRKLFRISGAPDDTFIIGGSMGGYGALKCAFARPDIFGHCMAFSSAGLFMEEDWKMAESGTKEISARLFRDMKAAFEACPSEKENLLSLVDAEHSAIPSVYMICGDKDPYLSENRRFAEELKKRPQIPFSYREIPGKHDWFFFDSALKTGLSELIGSESE